MLGSGVGSEKKKCGSLGMVCACIWREREKGKAKVVNVNNFESR